jgi:hypothetical protein
MKPEFSHTGLSAKSRFVLAFIFYAAVALLQILIVKGGSFPGGLLRFAGILLLIVPLWFLKAKKFSNKPADQGKEEWKPVTMNEIDRLTDRIHSFKKARVPLIYGSVLAVISIGLSLFILFALGIDYGVNAAFIYIDLYLIFIPCIWFAQVKRWYPRELADKLDIFSPVINIKLPETLQLDPMIRFDEDKQGLPVPEDFKLMISPKPGHGPADLLGSQFQLTYNDGPNGMVPYMYEVFINRGKGKTWGDLKKLNIRNHVIEGNSSKEGDEVYGSVVLRLNTDSRSDVYHTKREYVENLASNVVHALEGLLI